MTYTTPLPIPTNPPASDVVNMQNNTIAVNNWVQVDHVGFNAGNSGYHNQVTIAKTQTAPGLANGAVGDIYANVGVADAAHAQAFFQNTQLSFPLSLVRAYGVVLEAGGINTSQSFNVVMAPRVSTGFYQITLVANACASTAYGVLVTGAPNSGNFVNIFSYQIGSPTVFNVFVSKPESTSVNRNAPFSFIVLQL